MQGPGFGDAPAIKMPFPFFDETEELTAAARNHLGGSFVALSGGVTHYELGGREQGVPVVLVHGFSVPNYIFDPTFEFLCKEGFRVLRYDLFGRGLSDRPDVKYDIQLFLRQLKELLDALQFRQVNLVGLSMGGPITTSFVEQFPEKIQRHILIDPAGAMPIHLSALLKAVRTPWVGEVLLGLFGSVSMVKSIASDLFTPELVAEFQAKYKVQMKYRGFKRAILSTMRNGMLESFIDTYDRGGRLKKPTLLFWGRQDKTVPFEHSADILRAMPHAEFRVIENCGHIPHYERPGEVNPILLEFLRRRIESQ